MSQEKYIGMDVHQATISVAVMDAHGKLPMECLPETKDVGDIIISRKQSQRTRSKAMSVYHRVFSLLVAIIVVCAWPAQAQESQSLGDAARQARLQKQRKDAKGKAANANTNEAQPAKTPKKVVTNDDIPEHVGSTLTSAHTLLTPGYVPPSYGPQPAVADQLKSMIQAQKAGITSLQRNIDNLTQSLEHPETCLADCAHRDESQRQKAMQLEAMKVQLDQQQKRLEDVQELIRKQGFGSSVYDP